MCLTISTFRFMQENFREFFFKFLKIVEILQFIYTLVSLVLVDNKVGLNWQIKMVKFVLFSNFWEILWKLADKVAISKNPISGTFLAIFWIFNRKFLAQTGKCDIRWVFFKSLVHFIKSLISLFRSYTFILSCLACLFQVKI